MHSLAKSVALGVIAASAAAGCRDWGRFESVETGAGGAGAGNAGGGSGTSMPSTTGTGTATGMTTTSTMSTTGPGGGGGGSNTDCGTIDILSDAFDGGDLDWKWGNDTEYFSLQNGELVLLYPAGEAGFQIETTAGFDFTGRGMIFEVSEAAAGVDLWFNVGRNSDNYFEILVDGNNNLRLTYEDDGDYVTISEEPFDPIAHRFWRLREADGNVHYEVSPDGSNWTEKTQRPAAPILDPRFSSVFIGGYTYGTGSAEFGRVADLYSDTPSTGGLCGPTVFTDDFEDQDPGGAWEHGWWTSECPVEEVGSVVRISCTAGVYADSAFGSTSAYDLQGSSVSVEIVDYPDTGSNGWMGLAVVRPEIESLWSFEVDNGELALYEGLDGDYITVGSVPYNPDAGRFLRIREDSGNVYFEQSPDNQNYGIVFQRQPPFDIGEVKVFLGGGANGPPTDVTFAFDNLNLGP
jgi:hypothetical protein